MSVSKYQWAHISFICFRFAHFFIQPVFEGVNYEALKKMLEIYYYGHDTRVFDDEQRIAVVEKLFGDPSHPYSNLANGTS